MSEGTLCAYWLPHGTIEPVPKALKPAEDNPAALRDRLVLAMTDMGYDVTAKPGRRMKGAATKADAKLAELSGVSPGQISKLRNAKRGREPSFETIYRLAKELKVRTDWLGIGDLPRARDVSELAEDPLVSEFLSWFVGNSPLVLACARGRHSLSTAVKAKVRPLRDGARATDEQWDDHLAHLRAVDVSKLMDDPPPDPPPSADGVPRDRRPRA